MGVTMHEIQLIAIVEGNYYQWHERKRATFNRLMGKESPEIAINRTLSDLENIVPTQSSLPQPNWHFSFPGNTKLKIAERVILKKVRPAIKIPLGKWIFDIVFLQIFFPRFKLKYPTFKGRSINRNKTLEELGFSSGDLAIIGFVQPPLATSSFIAGPMFNTVANNKLKSGDLLNFLDSVISDDRYSYRVDMWDDGKPRPSSILGAVVLYTEEDWELASYVRQHYAPLHILSGHYVTMYFFEHMPPQARSFWESRLPRAVFKMWADFELISSKPHFNEGIYKVANEISLSPDKLPCMVFFRKWKEIKENRIVIPIIKPYPSFFRELFTDITHGIENYKGVQKDEDFINNFSVSDFYEHVPSRWHSKVVEAHVNGLEINQKYDVALSFAEEDRDTAHSIATLLKEKGLAVFYDRDEQGEIWGKNLYEHLSDIYTNRAKYCVMLISSAYAQKRWTTHERRSAQARAFREKREYILPVRLDMTKIPGIPETVAYLDIKKSSLQQIANAVQGKLHDLIHTNPT